MLMKDTEKCWANIERWMDENSPSLKTSLNLPASLADIKEVKALLKLDLPSEYIDLYRRHDGQNTSMHANLFYGLPFLSIHEGMREYENLIAQNMEYIPQINYQYIDKEISPSASDHLSRFPLAGGIDVYAVFVDLAPSDVGKYGQVVFIDYEMEVALKVSNSVSDMVCEFYSGLNSGSYELSSGKDESWLHTSKDVDLSNWYYHNQKTLNK